MAKKKRPKASKRKSKRAKKKEAVPKIKVPIIDRPQATIQDVEAAIAKKLATEPTDLFMKNEKVIIEIDDFEA